jgi:5'(3')-deoxyribonucleotidase
MKQEAVHNIPIRPERDKPIVLVDCDGVLADFTQAALDLVFEETGERHRPEDIKTWEIFETIGVGNKDLQKRTYDKIKSKGQCFALSVYPEAQEGLKKLGEIAEVVIVTAPFYGSETWVHERETWLEKHFKVDAHDIIHARKKYHVYGDFLIDDRAKHIRKWSRRWPGSHGLLWDGPGNRDEDLPRVKSWSEVYNKVDEVRRNRAPRRTEERQA